MLLPNFHSCSDPTVYPSNWQNTGASFKHYWYIQHYFYDPIFKEKYKNGKLFIVKEGINRLKTLLESREAVKIILGELISLLKNEGYNAIIKVKIPPFENNYEIPPATHCLTAIGKEKNRLILEKSTLADMKSCLLK